MFNSFLYLYQRVSPLHPHYGCRISSGDQTWQIHEPNGKILGAKWGSIGTTTGKNERQMMSMSRFHVDGLFDIPTFCLPWKLLELHILSADQHVGRIRPLAFTKAALEPSLYSYHTIDTPIIIWSICKYYIYIYVCIYIIYHFIPTTYHIPYVEP